MPHRPVVPQPMRPCWFGPFLPTSNSLIFCSSHISLLPVRAIHQAPSHHGTFAHVYSHVFFLSVNSYASFSPVSLYSWDQRSLFWPHWLVRNLFYEGHLSLFRGICWNYPFLFIWLIDACSPPPKANTSRGQEPQLAGIRTPEASRGDTSINKYLMDKVIIH